LVGQRAAPLVDSSVDQSAVLMAAPLVAQWAVELVGQRAVQTVD
jgi:hypothetical protein